MWILRFFLLVRYDEMKVINVPIEPKIESASVMFSRVKNVEVSSDIRVSPL